MEPALARWKLNSKNQTITSDLCEKAEQVHGFNPRRHSNKPILPYIGQLGWAIEYPEYADDDATSSAPPQISGWNVCKQRPSLLFKLLKNDPGFYRARWTYESLRGATHIIYSEAETMGEDFRWNSSALQAILRGDPTSWDVEVLVPDLDESTRGKPKPHWIPCCHPDWSNTDLAYRLVWSVREVPNEFR